MTSEKATPVTAPTLQEPRTTGAQEMFILLATRFMALALALVCESLLAYALLPEGRGAYAICVLFAYISGIVITPGADWGTQYFVMARQLSISQGTSIGFAICIIGSGIAVGVAIPLIHSDLGFFQNADTRSFYLALMLIPVISLSTVTQLQLAGLRRFVQLAVFSFLSSAVLVIAVGTFVWGLGLGVDGALMALTLGGLTMIVVGVLDLRRHCGLVFELPSRKGFKWVLGYGLKDYMSRVGFSIDPRVGGVLLGIAGGRADIGFFSSGSALMTRFLTIPEAISSYLLPRVASADRGRPELVAFCARIAWWSTGCALLAWVAVSAPVVPLILSKAFSPVIHLTWILAIGIWTYAGAETFVAYFRGTNRPQVCSWAVWLGLCVNVVLFFTLYPALGVKGAAWAMTGGFLCRSLFLGFMFHRTTQVPMFSTLLLRRTDIVYLWTSGRSLVGRYARVAN